MNPGTASIRNGGPALDAARARLADLDGRHAGGQHFWRWTGRTHDGHHVLGCMFCGRRTVAR